LQSYRYSGRAVLFDHRAHPANTLWVQRSVKRQIGYLIVSGKSRADLAAYLKKPARIEHDFEVDRLRDNFARFLLVGSFGFCSPASGSGRRGRMITVFGRGIGTARVSS
jgi:hypothetical protein